MRPDTAGFAADLKVGSYGGQQVLVWWEGDNNAGIGSGEHVIMDASYRVITRIAAANGRKADLHELQLTDHGTALFLADAPVGPSPAVGRLPALPRVMDCAIQEIDLATGQLVLEWHGVDHIGIDESVTAAPTGSDQVYDYLHANSIEEDADGDLLVSARNTSAIYKIGPDDGRDPVAAGRQARRLQDGPGTSFALQHDARRQPDGTLSLFDDGQAPGHSRAISCVSTSRR